VSEEIEELEEDADGWSWEDTASLIADFTPVVGDVKGAYETYDAFSEGDYVGGTVNAIATGLGVIPIVGDAAGKAVKTAYKSFEEVSPAINKQLSRTSYDKTWDEFEAIDDVSDWQKTVKKYVKDDRSVDPVVRTPELEKSARELRDGVIDRAEHLNNVQKYKPVTPWTDLPRAPTDKSVVYSLKPNQRADGNFVLDNAAAKSFGVTKSALSEGDKFNGRLDIPAYKDYDTWIVAGTSKAQSGTHYAKAVHYVGDGDTPVKFLASQKMGQRIGAGEADKTGYATVSGWVKSLDADAIRESSEKLVSDPEWLQVGFDPRRQGAFYARSGDSVGAAVSEADEVIQIGPLVFAKGAKIDADYRGFADGGLMADMRTTKGRAVYQDEETGENYSEKSVTFQMDDGSWLTIPSVDEDGEQFSQEELEDFVRKNGPVDPVTGADLPVFNDVEDAEDYAKQRSDSLLPRNDEMESAPAEDMPEDTMSDTMDDVAMMSCGGLMGGGMPDLTMMSGAVPPGSLESEVADDIPAFLSTGEYVLSADVVRWHGLKHIMDMRFEAKSGLMSMDYEGQIESVYDEDEKPEEEYETPEGNTVEVSEVETEDTAEEFEPCEYCDGEGCEQCMDSDDYPTKEGQFSYSPGVSFALIK